MRRYMLVALALSACGGEADRVDGLDPSCAPLYTPTFDAVFDNTLSGTCAQAGTFCHASEGAKGGLILDDRDGAYAALVESSPARVNAGDAATSMLMLRIEIEGDKEMPPGMRLDTAERCAIQKWIEVGAKR